jgi:hypothetical protein
VLTVDEACAAILEALRRRGGLGAAGGPASDGAAGT